MGAPRSTDIMMPASPGAHALQEAERVPAVPTHILSMAFPFFTIGHSTRSVAELAGLLQQAGAGLLVDVRAIPRSRTNPQFNADALPESLAPWPIGYRHIRSLGGLRGHPRDQGPSPSAYWENRSFRNYADYTATEPFRAGLAELRELGRTHVCAIMCAEAVWRRCHRRFIANYLISEGERVFHIMGAGKIEPAVLTPAATSNPALDPGALRLSSRVDPADVSVAAAIDDVQPAARAIAEHQHLLVGQVHAHDRLADGEHRDLGRGFGDHGGERRGLAVNLSGGLLVLAQHVLPPGFRALAVRGVARVLVHAAAVAAQALGDVLGGVVEGAVGVRRLALAAQCQAAAGVHVDVAGEEASRAAEGHVRLQRVVEVLTGDRVEVIGNAHAKRVREVHLLA